MDTYDRLMMRDPDADDLRRYPEALRVLEGHGIVWAMNREQVQELRDLCDEALRDD